MDLEMIDADDFDTYPNRPVSRSLTIREHFAAVALQGILAYPADVGTPEKVTKTAVKYADLLIKQLNAEVSNEQSK